jgi:hypothetical protein
MVLNTYIMSEKCVMLFDSVTLALKFSSIKRNETSTAK